MADGPVSDAAIESSLRLGPLFARPLRDVCCSRHASHEPRGIWRELLRSQHLTPRCGLFIDVGTSFDMADGAEALALNFSVLAFEPRHDMASRVRSRFREQLLAGALSVVNAATSNRPGTASLYLGGDSSTTAREGVGSGVERLKYERGGNQHVRVPMVTVDSVIHNHAVAVLKVE